MTKMGVNSQLGIANETVFGTPVTPTRFYEFNSESVELEIDTVFSEGIRPGFLNLARSGGYMRHRKGAAGDVELDVMQRGFGIWLRHMLGQVVTTGAGPYTHTGSIASLNGGYFTLQVGRDDQPFTYEGCKVTDWELSCAIGEFLKLTLTIDAEAENNSTPLAVPSYPTGLRPFSFLDASATVGGVATNITEFKLSAKNNLAVERYFMRNSGLKGEPLNQNREITGELTLEFDDLTTYNRFLNATESAVILTFTSGPDSFTIDCPLVLFEGQTPTVKNPELIMLSMPFRVLSNAATQIRIVNNEPVA